MWFPARNTSLSSQKACDEQRIESVFFGQEKRAIGLKIGRRIINLLSPGVALRCGWIHRSCRVGIAKAHRSEGGAAATVYGRPDPPGGRFDGVESLWLRRVDRPATRYLNAAHVAQMAPGTQCRYPGDRRAADDGCLWGRCPATQAFAGAD